MPNKSSPHGSAVVEGAVSSGTLRTQDLLRTFADVLLDVMPFNGRDLAHSARCAADEADDHPTDETLEAADDILNALFDQLDTIASREGMYFGGLEGDGACFGFWRAEETD